MGYGVTRGALELVKAKGPGLVWRYVVVKGTVGSDMLADTVTFGTTKLVIFKLVDGTDELAEAVIFETAGLVEFNIVAEIKTVALRRVVTVGKLGIVISAIFEMTQRGLRMASTGKAFLYILQQRRRRLDQNCEDTGHLKYRQRISRWPENGHFTIRKQFSIRLNPKSGSFGSSERGQL